MGSSRLSGSRAQGSALRRARFCWAGPRPGADRLRPAAPGPLSRALWLIPVVAGVLLGAVGRAEDPEAERRRRIEKIQTMSPPEKKQLLRQYDRFRAFSPAEQQRLRQLHEQIQNDPDADRLRRIMQAYCRWLKSLPAYRRAELLNLEPAERIERIRQIRDEEAKRPQLKDMEGLLRWMDRYAAEHEAEILKAIPEKFRRHLSEASPRVRKWMVERFLWMRWQMARSGKPPWLTDDDLAGLREELSDEARKRLEKEPAAAQWQTIGGWIRRGGRSFWSRRFRAGPPPKELQDQLYQLFEELPSEEKDRLLNQLPGEEIQRELERLYFRRFWPMRPPGPVHGRKPGQRGGHPGRSEAGPAPGHRSPRRPPPAGKGPNDRQPPPVEKPRP